MLRIVESKEGKLRLFRIVVLDVAAVSIMTGLFVSNIVPLYPTGPIAFFGLFIANYLIIWKATQQRDDTPAQSSRISLLVWFGVILFTTSAVVMVVFLINKPNIQSATQAIIGIMLAGYAWFLVHRLRQSRKDEDSK